MHSAFSAANKIFSQSNRCSWALLTSPGLDDTDDRKESEEAGKERFIAIYIVSTVLKSKITHCRFYQYCVALIQINKASYTVS